MLTPGVWGVDLRPSRAGPRWAIASRRNESPIVECVLRRLEPAPPLNPARPSAPGGMRGCKRPGGSSRAPISGGRRTGGTVQGSVGRSHGRASRFSTGRVPARTTVAGRHHVAGQHGARATSALPRRGHRSPSAPDTSHPAASAAAWPHRSRRRPADSRDFGHWFLVRPRVGDLDSATPLAGAHRGARLAGGRRNPSPAERSDTGDRARDQRRADQRVTCQASPLVTASRSHLGTTQARVAQRSTEHQLRRDDSGLGAPGSVLVLTKSANWPMS
jgi:hypothetical protein